MFKKTLFYLLILSLVFVPAVSLGISSDSKSNQNGQNVKTQSQNQSEEENAQSQNQSTVRNQTNNPETGEMTQERSQEEIRLEIEENQPEYTPDDSSAADRKKITGKVVENLYNYSYEMSDQILGAKVRTTAKAQSQDEDVANEAIDGAKRNSFAQFFIGPNYNRLNEAKQVMERNRLRIKELQQIKSQVENSDEQSQLENQILVLEAQNNALENQLETINRKFSLLGWLFRLIYQY